MLQRVKVAPQYPLFIDFADGTTKQCLQCIESLILLVQEFGEIEDILREYENRPYDLTAIILYSGMKILDASITLDECKLITMSGGLPLMNEVLEQFNKNIGSMSQEEIKKQLEIRMAVMQKHQNQAIRKQ